jgi:hypothetical protein
LHHLAVSTEHTNNEFVFLGISWDKMKAGNETVNIQCKGEENGTSVVLQLRNV